MPRVSARRRLLPAAALFVAVGVGLLLGELAVRLALPQARLVITPAGLYEPDPPGRVRLSPGYRGRLLNRAEYAVDVRIDANGLRGSEPPAGGATRILAIGDSFVFGVGVEDDETFVARLAQRMSRKGQPSVALNAGVPTFGVPDSVSWLERHGLALSPDVVVLGIFQGNDLIDASPDRPGIRLVDGLMVPVASPGGPKAWLHRHSHLYLAAKGLLERPSLKPVRSRLGLGEPWVTRNLREEFSIYRDDVESRLAPAIAATDQALARIAELSRRHGFELVCLLIPSEIQLDPRRWANALASLDLDPRRHDPEGPRRIFLDLLALHDIPVVDPAPELAARMAAGEEMYFPLDRHWTEAAHQLAADLLARRESDSTARSD